MDKRLLAAAAAAVTLMLCAPAAAQRNSLRLFRGNEGNLPLLVAGEAAFTLDSHRLFVGDGTTNWGFWPKTALDTFYNSAYAALGHTHAASAIASGNLNIERMPAAGMTTVITVRNAGGAADCTITVTNGLITGTTCSHT